MSNVSTLKIQVGATGWTAHTDLFDDDGFDVGVIVFVEYLQHQRLFEKAVNSGCEWDFWGDLGYIRKLAKGGVAVASSQFALDDEKNYRILTETQFDSLMRLVQRHRRHELKEGAYEL